MILLSKRLRMNASLVTEGYRLADVGTDHGYIPIALVQEGKIPSALAMDVNPGPLGRAEQHIKEYQLDSVIHTRLSDGVKQLQPAEADSVLIAGMGGALIIKILEEGKEVLKTVKELILQPQSEIDKVRRYLVQAGYVIVKEDMVFEDGKYYPVMKAELGEMQYEQEIFYQFGKLLLEQEHPVLLQYLKFKCLQNQGIIERMQELGDMTERRSARIQELKQEQQLIGDAFEYFPSA